MPTEQEMLNKLRWGEVTLPPLSFRVEKSQPGAISNETAPDIILIAFWRGEKLARFAVECKSSSTPRIFQSAIDQVRRWRLPRGIYPMILTPYLNEEQLGKLEEERISGIDLCGNGLVFVDRVLSVFRTGAENLFPSSAPIKNVYRKNSSMVGRVFLARSTFLSVQAVQEEVNRRNALVERWNKTPMGLSTVSKVLKALEDDLIIDREEEIHLLQPEKLLANLSESYEPPSTGEQVRIKAPGEEGAVLERLRRTAEELNLPWQVTGKSSVNRYATMQRGDMVSVYCPQLRAIMARMGGSENDRFPNLELVETDDERVFFDGRLGGGLRWASPIQVYLELMRGDKRDQETAEQVRQYILNSIEDKRMAS